MNNFNLLVEEKRDFLRRNGSLDVEFRVSHLKLLRDSIIKNEDKILSALNKDLGKSYFEGYETEIGMVLSEINYTIKHLKSWAKPKKVKTPITQFPSRGYIYRERYGVVLIMSPWNYPFQLSMTPLISAIAGGNACLLKPSNYSKHTTNVIGDIIEEVFPHDYVSVIVGGREANAKLLDERFDYIFFTGSYTVGKVVMKKASENLTPVTLELGGKSPCIVDETADIDLAAKRIIWGKLLNSGQTCVAPDYILVQNNVKKDLVKSMEKYIVEFFGEEPCENEEYPKIINEKHFNRLKNLMDDGKILFGGKVSRENMKIEPCLIDNVNENTEIMQDEIFGPLIPIVTFNGIHEVIDRVNRGNKPLALYYFTTNKKREKQIINEISFGGGCINDTIVHLTSHNMPFGGVGLSGMGSYHGKWGFNTFTHEKSILKKSNKLDIKVRYAPYKDKLNLIKKLMK